MSDMFNRSNDSFAGSFSADGARMLFSMPGTAGVSSAEPGMLVQQLGIQYAQQLTRLYEISSNSIYLVGGRTSGNGSLNRVMGPKKLAKEFYLTYGDICNAARNLLQFEAAAGCGEAFEDSAAIHCKFLVVQQVSFSMNVGDMLINEAMAMMFSSMVYN